MFTSWVPHAVRPSGMVSIADACFSCGRPELAGQRPWRSTDPTSTHGKNASKAKDLELAGWPYPKHLAGRTYGVVVHGDVAGIEGVRRGLSDWLDWMGLIDAGAQARLDRFIGYYESYAESHAALDRDHAVQEEVRNVARAVAEAVAELRRGALSVPDRGLRKPRPK